MGLGDAIGGAYRLPQQQEQAPMQSGTQGSMQDLPEFGGDKDAMKAFPGTAESESYIESIQGLENWLSEQYSQGIHPDKVGDGSPESLAAGRIFRHKKASIKRQASHLSEMMAREKMYQSNLAKGDVYERGETGTDPLSGLHFAPTQEDYSKVVRKEMPPVAQAFQKQAPTGNLYDSKAIMPALDNYKQAVDQTNAYYDDLAGKFQGTQYGENVESARQNALSVMGTLRPIQKRAPKGSGDTKMSSNDRNEITAGVMSGDLGALKGGKYGSDSVTRAALKKGKIVMYGNKTVKGQVYEVKLGEMDVNDKEGITAVLNKKDGFGEFTLPELERAKQFPVTAPAPKVWSAQDDANFQAIISDPTSEANLDILREGDDIYKVTYDKGSSSLLGGWPSIDVEYQDEDKETEKINPTTDEGKARLKELYMETQDIEGEAPVEQEQPISERALAAFEAQEGRPPTETERQAILNKYK